MNNRLDGGGIGWLARWSEVIERGNPDERMVGFRLLGFVEFGRWETGIGRWIGCEVFIDDGEIGWNW